MTDQCLTSKVTCRNILGHYHQVVFEEEDNDLIDLASTMASVSASYGEAKIGVNVFT